MSKTFLKCFFVQKISALLNCWGESRLVTSHQPESYPKNAGGMLHVFSTVLQLFLASPYPGASLLPCALCRAGPSWSCARLHEGSSAFLSNSIVIQWQTGAAVPSEVEQKFLLLYTGRKHNTCVFSSTLQLQRGSWNEVLLMISLPLKKFRTPSLKLFSKSCCRLDMLALI